MKVNLGCGSQVVDGWVNVDYAAGARLLKNPLIRALNHKFGFFKMEWSGSILIHDLRKRFPWNSNAIDVIYSSHTLEHLSREDGLKFLQECLRVLKPGGIIRLIVPDLRAIVSRYLSGEILADDFLLKLDVESAKETRGLLRRLLSMMVSFPHRCMYDENRLITIMQDLGFKISPGRPLVSEIANIEKIERRDRTEGAVIVEGRKG